MSQSTVSEGTPAVHCHNLVRRFGDVLALDDVSFAVSPGEVFGLLGPNGAGKTTCLRILVTLLAPDSGRVEVGGFDTQVDPESVKRLIGFQTGDTRLYERLTPVEFLRYFGKLHGLEQGVMEHRIDALIEELDIGDYQKRLCGALSTGQQQRVSLARALLHDPHVLVLDEPTSGLDIVSAQTIIRLLQRQAARGKAIVFSTHIMAEAELVCDRIGVLNEGRLALVGTLDELLEHTGQRTLLMAFLDVVGAIDAAPAAAVIP